ncbi:hypothetical protein [Paenibacillus nasutitermitis]|uniref:Uncharacterized protein n=1 Tax=Paenibacillus nasutitermitis TaxID=1652958 RepID=A0A916YK30_9BACL|nr:hypothetical protein [Paenibacillus nasutitermitis]GGD49491.1 hypothetical protein GCM10010911_03770 [Paenibacillus nasutitermitis]
MNTDIKTTTYNRQEQIKRRSRSTFPLFLAVWMILIASGVVGAIWYTGKMKTQMQTEISRQTAKQISAMQTDYQNRIKQLETSFAGEITKVQGKVDALNQLLKFTKDNANDKTDNSNQLYTQINEVKKKLAELQKSLDVLK